MKKLISLIVIVAVMLLVFVGGVFAQEIDQGCVHSQARDVVVSGVVVVVGHASDTAKDSETGNANPINSVLKRCCIGPGCVE